MTGDLFDRWAFLSAKRRDLLDRSWAGVFRQHLLTRLPVEKLAPLFRTDDGRPSNDLHVALGVLILQQMFDLTDAQVVESAAFNMAWHFAFGFDRAAFCHA
ncbi:MAG: transposase [Planctomycetota bacterium]